MKKLLFLSIVVCSFHISFSQDVEVLSIKNDSAEIYLESLNINVEVIGNIATTVTEMTFFNPNDRDLEGELNFPLAEGQSVYRFAMDVNGKLREGVAVEKNLGRKAFEGVVRQAIDPGLLEMTAGNNYKARVYPIPANGRKSILIGYEEELSNTDIPFYQLVMNYGEVHEFSIEVNVLQQEIEPQFRDNEITNFRFEKWQNSFTAKHSESNFKAAGIMSFEVPVEHKERVLRQTDKGHDTFYISMIPEHKSIAKELPSSVGIIWDASKSGIQRDIEKELRLIDQYFEKLQNAQVTVVRFSNDIIDTAEYIVENGNSEQLQQHLENTIYDGGTNLASIKFDRLEVDEIFLFSDGLSNLGDLDTSIRNIPVNTITSNKSSSHTSLKYLSETTGGDFVNLLNTPVDAAISSLLTHNYQFLYADFNDSRITEVYPDRSTTLKQNTNFSIAGMINTKKNPTLIWHSEFL